MKITHSILMFVSAVIISSCKDKVATEPADAPDPYFRVKVVEVETGVPVPDADVYLFDEAESGSGITLHDHMYSDENGDVVWLKTDSVDMICVEKSGYFNSCGTGYYLGEPPVSQGKYEMFPYAWIRISVVDDEPLNPEIYIEHTLNEPGLSGYHGISPDYPFIQRVIGNMNTFVNVLQLDYVDFQEYDTLAFDHFTLNAPAFDTLDFVYHY